MLPVDQDDSDIPIRKPQEINNLPGTCCGRKLARLRLEPANTQ